MLQTTLTQQLDINRSIPINYYYLSHCLILRSCRTLTHRCQLFKVNFRDTLYEFQGHLICMTFIIPRHDKSLQNYEEAPQKSGEIIIKCNARWVVVPLVTLLSIFQNGRFVGDFAIVCKSSKFLSFEIRTTIFNTTKEV